MGVATATVGGKKVAEATEWEEVEGNVYFPPSAIDKSYFSDSSTTTVCPWKGTASYYNIKVDGTELQDAAWYYPSTGDKAKHIENYVAFYKSKVQVTKS